MQKLSNEGLTTLGDIFKKGPELAQLPFKREILTITEKLLRVLQL